MSRLQRRSAARAARVTAAPSPRREGDGGCGGERREGSSASVTGQARREPRERHPRGASVGASASLGVRASVEDTVEKLIHLLGGASFAIPSALVFVGGRAWAERTRPRPGPGRAWAQPNPAMSLRAVLLAAALAGGASFTVPSHAPQLAARRAAVLRPRALPTTSITGRDEADTDERFDVLQVFPAQHGSVALRASRAWPRCLRRGTGAEGKPGVHPNEMCL